MTERTNPAARERVPVILAVGLVVCLAMLCFAAMYDALFSNDAGLSENATQILSTTFGGIIGVLGSALGFRQGSERRADELDAAEHGRPDVSPSSGVVHTRGPNTMSTTTPEPRDPATNPDRDLTEQPQDPDVTVEPDDDGDTEIPKPRR